MAPRIRICYLSSELLMASSVVVRIISEAIACSQTSFLLKFQINEAEIKTRMDESKKCGR